MTVAHFCVEEIQVRATAQRCYDLVLAVRRSGQWWQPIRCAALGPEGTLRVGSCVRYTADFGSWVSEVARLEPYRRIDLQHTDGDLRGPAGWEFAPQGEVTRVRYVLRGVRANGPSPGNAAVRCLQTVMRMAVL